MRCFSSPGSLLFSYGFRKQVLHVRQQRTDDRRQISLSVVRLSVIRRLEVGFPIRRFPDQSLFAAPRDLSQRTTSFIASQRQGIHQIPLWHLIALIAKARFFLGASDRQIESKRTLA